MKKLYKFYWDCGRNGHIDSIFIAEESAIENVIGKKVYFGEVLGKHSAISGKLEKNDFKVLPVSEQTVQELLTVVGETISGHNPLEYLELNSEP